VASRQVAVWGAGALAEKSSAHELHGSGSTCQPTYTTVVVFQLQCRWQGARAAGVVASHVYMSKLLL